MSVDASVARWVVSTAPDLERARALARALVEERLAACVSFQPGLASVYRWKGAVEEATEVLLLIKTTAERLPELERAFARLHPYEVPELIAFEPTHVAAPYLAWLVAEVERQG
ncbi:MAG: divalent-cation tolerance protein CutA [Planctomycetota bacterium]|nr:divalent-cation tolerance protein CutA [Planctomycetota bacterium]